MARVELIAVRLPQPRRTARTAPVWAELAPFLALAPGVCNVILGPDGAGKSALLDVLAGLRAPVAGRVLFDAADVTARTASERNVTRVGAAPVVYPRLSVGDNLAWPLRRRGWSAMAVDARVAEISDALGLGSVRGQRAGALPPALRQRVALGRAFVRSDAAAILLDNPFMALAAQDRGALHDALRALVVSVHATVVLTTCELDEALSIADRLLFLEHGRVVQDGPPEAVFERPRTSELARMLCGRELNLLPCEVRDDAFVVGSARIARKGLALQGVRDRRVELAARLDELRLVDLARDSTVLAQLESVERRNGRRIATLRFDKRVVRVWCDDDQHLVPGGRYHVELPSAARVYVDGELADG